MHRSRLCAVLIDCKTSDVDEAARFWSEALGRSVDKDHQGSRGNYRMLKNPPDEPIVQIQRVDHDSRVHLDIETDDIPAEVARLEELGAKVVSRPDLQELAFFGKPGRCTRTTQKREAADPDESRPCRRASLHCGEDSSRTSLASAPWRSHRAPRPGSLRPSLQPAAAMRAP